MPCVGREPRDLPSLLLQMQRDTGLQDGQGAQICSAHELRVSREQAGSTRHGGARRWQGLNPKLVPAQATGSLGNQGPWSQVPGLQRHLGAAVPSAGMTRRGHEEL